MKRYYIVLVILFLVVSCKKKVPEPKAEPKKTSTLQKVGIQTPVKIPIPKLKPISTPTKKTSVVSTVASTVASTSIPSFTLEEKTFIEEEKSVAEDFIPEHIRQSHIEVVEHY